jgi:hypothetical protein
VTDITDPGDDRSLRLYKLRDEILESSRKNRSIVTWWHTDLPLDPRCNENAENLEKYGRGCEVAAARKALQGTPQESEFDEWLRESSWTTDPDAIRLKVDELTKQGAFLDGLPELLRKVRSDVTRATRMGVRRPPVVTVNEKEMDTDEPAFIVWAVEIERKVHSDVSSGRMGTLAAK